MAESPQTYETHTRWHTPFHYLVAPVMLTNVVVAVVQLVRDPGLDRGWRLVVSLALLVLAGLAREVLAGRLDRPDDIKRAIKGWRADTLRV